MRSDEAKLAARREELLRRSAELRSRIADDGGAISNHLRVIDKVSAFLHSEGGRTIAWGGLVLMLIAGPGRVLKVAGRTAILWSLARRWVPRALALKRGQHRT